MRLFRAGECICLTDKAIKPCGCERPRVAFGGFPGFFGVMNSSESVPPVPDGPLEVPVSVTDEARLIAPGELATWIVFEDDDLLVVNKPGEVVCHPSKNGPWSSLVGACREYTGLERIHLVHRLDRETSGLVLMAKNRRTARLTQMAFQDRKVRKEYLAIVEGEWPEPKRIRNRLAKDLDSPVYIKQTVRDSNSAQTAETEFVPVWSGSGYSLVRIVPLTGRKHQIRVHASWEGHPIVGDKIYGPDDRLYLAFIENGWSEELAARLLLRRQALHASRIVFEVPEFPRAFSAELPEDMAAFLRDRMGWRPGS